MKRNNRLFFTIIGAIVCAMTAWADTYEKVTSATQLIPGASYLFVYENEASSAVNGAYDSDHLDSVSVSITDGQFDCPNNAVPLTLGGTTDAWTFDMRQSSGDSHAYLSIRVNDGWRYLNRTTYLSNETKWTINFLENDLIQIQNSVETSYHIGYNSTYNTFRALSGSSTVSLYKKIERITSMAPDADPNQNPVYWATFSNLNSATFFPASEATVYKVVRTGNRVNENDVVSLTALTSQTVGSVVGYVVPANTGVMIGSSKSQVTYSTTSVESVNDATFFDNNLLHAATGGTTTAPGAGSYLYYKLAYGETHFNPESREDEYVYFTLGFYPGATGAAAYRASLGKAYLAWETSQGAPAHFILGEMAETETPTGIESPTSEVSARKVLQNGQMFILVNGTRYTVTGQTLQNR